MEPERVLLDANVFVSAIEDPLRQTDPFSLIVRLLEREDIRLVGDDVLAEEYIRNVQAFPSPTGIALSVAIVRRMEVARVEDRFVRACVPFFPATEAADCLHAATCLHTGAVLVSNDRHFRAIRAAGLIQVLTIAEAIRRWLP